MLGSSVEPIIPSDQVCKEIKAKNSMIRKIWSTEINNLYINLLSRTKVKTNVQMYTSSFFFKHICRKSHPLILILWQN